MAGKLVFDLLPVAKLRAKYVEIIYTVLRDLVEALAREPTKKVALVYENYRRRNIGAAERGEIKRRDSKSFQHPWFPPGRR